mgnify:CR=1 FL=1
MKQKWIDAFMDTADRFAQLSSSRRLHVGAVVVKDNRIISIGYNGTPAGWDNNCENEFGLDFNGNPTLVTKDEVIHAEANAISKLARSNDSGLGGAMFITHAPCLDCAKLIFQSGIGRVFYSENYRDDAGIQFLKKCNVEVICLTSST